MVRYQPIGRRYNVPLVHQTIYMPGPLVSRLDELVKLGYFRNRTEAIRFAVLLLIAEITRYEALRSTLLSGKTELVGLTEGM